MLDRTQIANYDRDGYLYIPDLFTSAEVGVTIQAVEEGGRVAQHTSAMSDASGRAARLALWTDIGNDVWGAATACHRMLNSVRTLLRDQAVFFHGKVILSDGSSMGLSGGTGNNFRGGHCEMTPGAALFFHSNLLHTSASNESDRHRRAFIVCFNALSNSRLAREGFGEWIGTEAVDGIAVQRPCPPATEEALARFI